MADISESVFLTARDVARLTKKSVSSVYDGIAKGTIPHARIGGSVKVPTAYIEEIERKALRGDDE